MVAHLIENHVIAVLDQEKEIPMTKMESAGIVVGVKIKNDEAKEVAESVRVKVEEVEVKRDPKKSAAGAESGVIGAAEVKIEIVKNEAKVMKGKGVQAKKEVDFVVLVAVVLEEGQGLLPLRQRHDLEVDLDVLEVVHQLTYP